tara:strand:- start:6226 stop:8325 length:2100 start_codon:yes stop_codon:yes gene_type:complete
MIDKKYFKTSLSTDVMYIKGVGPNRALALKKHGIKDVEDLLYYFPRKYLDRTNIKLISHVKLGEEAVIIGKVESFGIKKTRKRRYFQMILNDQSGYINCIWFNGISWISDKFTIGESVAIFGKVEFYNGKKVVHPDFDILDDDEDPVNTGKIIAQYSSNSTLKNVGLDSRGFRKIISKASDLINRKIEDFFDSDFCNKEGLYDLNTALQQIHNPKNLNNLKTAIYRLKYEQHFFLQLLMALKRQKNNTQKGNIYEKRGIFEKQIYEKLPFNLTKSQINVLRDIRNDLLKTKPMNRLIQGDVGSGKTIVSILASSIVLSHGAQVAVMAPTEILAEQHYYSFKKHCESVGICVALLIGNIKKSLKDQIYHDIKEGKIHLVIGTHAIIQKDVIFNKLGMIIIDEQHRFGVDQRKTLIQKGISPEVLALTATPIPRTLAFTLHGDMDISIIDELPQNRIPIITKVIIPTEINKIYDFMISEMKKGRQCFVIYPIIEESEKTDWKAAESGFKLLSEKIFKNFSVGYIHGKMKKEEKDFQMNAMIENKIQCLVSTTVVEVGIDIPNATVILIENAEKFGLTQLHQLRGRIGRGIYQSYSFLVQQKKTPDSDHRLNIMEKELNGFNISDEDLKLRGPGDFFGTQQHGYVKSNIIDFSRDGKIIRQARKRAFDMVTNDPKLSNTNNLAIKNKFMKNYKNMLEYVNIS